MAVTTYINYATIKLNKNQRSWLLYTTAYTYTQPHLPYFFDQTPWLLFFRCLF